jgi:hypothetical protein
MEDVFDLPFIKLLLVHSTWVVTINLVDTPLAHMMHVRVLTENTPPLGTSSVRFIVSITIEVSTSDCSVSSRISHLVCFGPTLAVNGRMYDMFLMRSSGLPSIGDQSDIWISEKPKLRTKYTLI